MAFDAFDELDFTERELDTLALGVDAALSPLEGSLAAEDVDRRQADFTEREVEPPNDLRSVTMTLMVHWALMQQCLHRWI